jgi:hypothetical protein
VPQWSVTVSEAISEACDEKEAGWCSDGRGIILPHPDAAVQGRALHGSVRYRALLMCSLWGRDPLPLNQIEVFARAVLNIAGNPLNTSRFEF